MARLLSRVGVAWYLLFDFLFSFSFSSRYWLACEASVQSRLCASGCAVMQDNSVILINKRVFDPWPSTRLLRYALLCCEGEDSCDFFVYGD